MPTLSIHTMIFPTTSTLIRTNNLWIKLKIFNFHVIVLATDESMLSIVWRYDGIKKTFNYKRECIVVQERVVFMVSKILLHENERQKNRRKIHHLQIGERFLKTLNKIMPYRHIQVSYIPMMLWLLDIWEIYEIEIIINPQNLEAGHTTWPIDLVKVQHSNGCEVSYSF